MSVRRLFEKNESSRAAQAAGSKGACFFLALQPPTKGWKRIHVGWIDHLPALNQNLVASIPTKVHEARA